MIIIARKTILSLIFILACGVTTAFPRDLLFLGLLDVKGESAQQHLEQALRLEFSVNPVFGMIDDFETQRIVREIERQGRKRTERFLPPGAGIADSVIVVRGIVKEDVEIKRHWLAWGRIDARMTINLYFNEAVGPAEYHGRFGAAASKIKKFVLFANPQKVVHISAVDRSELLSEVHAKIVGDISEFTTQWISTLSADRAPPAGAPTPAPAATTDSITVPEPGDSAEATEPATEAE